LNNWVLISLGSVWLPSIGILSKLGLSDLRRRALTIDKTILYLQTTMKSLLFGMKNWTIKTSKLVFLIIKLVNNKYDWYRLWLLVKSLKDFNEWKVDKFSFFRLRVVFDIWCTKSRFREFEYSRFYKIYGVSFIVWWAFRYTKAVKAILVVRMGFFQALVVF